MYACVYVFSVAFGELALRSKRIQHSFKDTFAFTYKHRCWGSVYTYIHVWWRAHKIFYVSTFTYWIYNMFFQAIYVVHILYRAYLTGSKRRQLTCVGLTIRYFNFNFVKQYLYFFFLQYKHYRATTKNDILPTLSFLIYNELKFITMKDTVKNLNLFTTGQGRNPVQKPVSEICFSKVRSHNILICKHF